MFEKFGSGFKVLARDLYDELQNQNSSSKYVCIFSELQEVLTGFVEKNPRSWAPLVSKWSLDTLGKLSSPMVPGYNPS